MRIQSVATRIFIAACAACVLSNHAAYGQDPENIEQLMERFEKIATDVKSWTADLTMKMNMQGMSITSVGDIASKNGLMTVNYSMDMFGQKIVTRNITDANGMSWFEMDINGTRQVMKMDMNTMTGMSSEDSGLASPPGGFGNSAGIDPVKMVGEMQKKFHLSLDGKETVDGVELYWVNATIKEGYKDDIDLHEIMEEANISMENARFAFGAEDGFLRRYESLAPDGTTTMSMALSNVTINPELDDPMFEYTPPEGVTVMDMSEMMNANLEQMPEMGQSNFPVGEAPPGFAGKTLGGDNVKLSDYLGKVVLIDFWATWCAPCIQELPHVITAYEKYHDRGFEIVAISLDEAQEDLESFLKEHPAMTWVQLFDGTGWESVIVAQYGVEGIPFTLLLDREGNVVASDLRGDALDEALERLLAE